MPTSIDALTYFIAYMHREGMAASTICTYASGIGYVNQLAGHPNPNQTFTIKKLLASVKRSTHQPDSRLPVTPALLNKLVESLTFTAPVCYNMIMLKAMYLLAFHAFLRVGEMTRNKFDTNILQLRDVQFFQTRQAHSSRLQITFRSFKGHYNTRPILLSLQARESHVDVCPVRSLYQFIERRGSQPGPLFCFPGNQFVSYEYFRGCLSNSLGWAGLPATHYKSHSLQCATVPSRVRIPHNDIVWGWQG